jgi:hypothetical protein
LLPHAHNNGAMLAASFAVADHCRVNTPNPALVSQREAEPLPRPALLPVRGVRAARAVRRDPWKSADITSFGYIVNIAQGKTGWLAPTVGGLPADGALLPYWIGAAFVRVLSPCSTRSSRRGSRSRSCSPRAVAHVVRRLPPGASESAQPLPFAFGGEAAPIDYARAIADGAVLALIASLGPAPARPRDDAGARPARRGRALPLRPRRGRRSTDAGGALAALAIVVSRRAARRASRCCSLRRAWRPARSPARSRSLTIAWLVARRAARRRAATALGAWANRLGAYTGGPVRRPARQIAGSHGPPGCSPVDALAMATSPRQLAHRRPARRRRRRCSSSGGDGRQRPRADARAAGARVLAAFALPTLQRSAAAAIDWFSVFFFTIAVATGWVFYVAMQTGTPAKLAANVAKLSPGYTNRFSWPSSSSRSRERSPGSGWCAGAPDAIAIRCGRAWSCRRAASSVCWLLVMTLLLPPLDNARSYRGDDAAHRARGAGGLVHRRAGHGARPGRRARVLRRLPGRRDRARAELELRFLMVTRTQKPPARAGSSSPANGATAATTTSPTSTARQAPVDARQRQRCDQLEASPRSRDFARGAGAAQTRTRTAGKTSLNVEPLPGSLAMSSSPPWRCMTCLTIASPSPVPPDSRERLPSTR